MNGDFKIENPAVQDKLQELGQYLKGKMPHGMGFTLLMSDFGNGGATFYISSIEREGALESMKEFLIKQGKIGEDGAIPSPFLESADLKAETNKGLPPPVQKLKEHAVVLIKAAVASNATFLKLTMGGFIAFGVDGDWEILVRRAEKL